MHTNKKYLAGILALAGLIVTPVISLVNHSQDVAEGSPLPPPVPHPKLFVNNASELIAEGSPLPPPVPHGPLAIHAVLTAEGSPLPPPVPHSKLATTLAA